MSNMCAVQRLTLSTPQRASAGLSLIEGGPIANTVFLLTSVSNAVTEFRTAFNFRTGGPRTLTETRHVDSREPEQN